MLTLIQKLILLCVFLFLTEMDVDSYRTKCTGMILCGEYYYPERGKCMVAYCLRAICDESRLYCEHHKCVGEDCVLAAVDNNNLCNNHKCPHAKCSRMKRFEEESCVDHTCGVHGCRRFWPNCHTHRCKYSGSDCSYCCSRIVSIDEGYCARHKCRVAHCHAAVAFGITLCANHVLCVGCIPETVSIVFAARIHGLTICKRHESCPMCITSAALSPYPKKLNCGLLCCHKDRIFSFPIKRPSVPVGDVRICLSHDAQSFYTYMLVLLRFGIVVFRDIRRVLWLTLIRLPI